MILRAMHKVRTWSMKIAINLNDSDEYYIPDFNE